MKARYIHEFLNLYDSIGSDFITCGGSHVRKVEGLECEILKVNFHPAIDDRVALVCFDKLGFAWVNLANLRFGADESYEFQKGLDEMQAAGRALYCARGFIDMNKVQERHRLARLELARMFNDMLTYGAFKNYQFKYKDKK